MFMGKIEAAADMRGMLAQLIASRLNAAADGMQAQWQVPGRIRTAYVDNLLPEAIAHAVRAAFPAPDGMMLRRAFPAREDAAASVDGRDPLLEEAVHAFQHPAVIEQVARITSLAGIEPDAGRHSGAISAMGEGACLRPHLDDSHDDAGSCYRVLNLLWFVSPGWDEPHGGNLQLWDHGPAGQPRTITSHFNRLVLMVTDRRSWHSVNAVRVPDLRCCVASTYFSHQSPEARDYFHAAAFRPEHAAGWRDLAMRADNVLRTGILKVTGNRVLRHPLV